MMIPVRLGDRVIGVLNIHTTVDRNFTQRDADVAMAFADQAAIALENARLMTAAEERVTELQKLQEISHAISTRLELPAVLEAVAARAMQLLGTQHTQITLWDEASQTLRYGAALGTEAERVRHQIFELGKGTNGTVALTRQPMLLEDYQASPYVVPECFDVVSTVTVPVLFSDMLLGVLHSHTTTPGKRFTPDDLRRLQQLAAQAAVAIENARLYEAERQRTAQLQAVMAISRDIVGERPLPALFQEVVARAIGLTRAHSGTLYLWDEGEQVLVPRAWVNLGDYMVAVRYRRGQGLTGAVVEAGQGLIWNNYATHPRRDAQVLQHVPFRACMASPLKCRDWLLGVLSLNHNQAGHQFTWDDFHLLETFASQMAVAIENAQLYEATRQHAATLEERVQERTQELAQANRQLQAASRHKSEFLANMSHELRTPLNSIIGFAEVLEDQVFGPLNAKQARYMANIERSGNHLLHMINDVLDLSKIEAGKLDLQRETLKLPPLLTEALGLLREAATKKGIECALDCAPDLPEVQADPRRLKQILFNLLSNAVKFTPEGGRITLAARRMEGAAVLLSGGAAGGLKEPQHGNTAGPQHWLEIRVADTGIGIKPEDQERIFGAFEQAERSYAKEHQGTGLGLALTKRLVEMHGGTIWVQSEGEGCGSTFAFTLPLR